MKHNLVDYNIANSNHINIKTNLITNFKPTIIKEIKEINFLNFDTNFKNKKNNNKNQIYCKNFLFYLLLLKYQKSFIFHKSSVFIKKFKKKVYTILRSPYRHKLARQQIAINRYEINSSIKIKISNHFKVKNWNKIISIFNFIKLFLYIFESNIVYTNSICISFPISYKLNFDINNFLIKNK